MLLDIFIIIFLILLNGFFAMSELAVVSARKARLGIRADAGSKGAKVALALANDPSRFLASIQIGITSIGILSGAYSGATLAGPLGDYFSDELGLATSGDDLAIGLVVVAVTYLSLIIGELVPKQLALKYAEPIASVVAIPIAVLAVIANPIVFLLQRSNRFVLWIMGVKEGTENNVTEEEVKAIITEGMESGALEQEEREMLERVMRLDDYDISVKMTHRQDIIWFDVDEELPSILEKIEKTRHSRYLLCDGSVEKMVGIVVVKDVLLQLGRKGTVDLRSIAHKPMCLSESSSILEALEEFKQSTANIAVLIDEYGTLQGLVSLKDLMEAIVGTLPEPAHREDYMGTQREDGSWLIDGGLSILEAEELLGASDMVADNETISTIAGFFLTRFGHVPKAGDHFTWRNWRFEVVDMDRNRIDKLMVHPIGTDIEI